jgi:AraC-like DNA-binding protein
VNTPTNSTNSAEVSSNVQNHSAALQTKGWGIAVYPAGATFGPRRMTDWEFVWLIEGDAEYSWGTQTVSAPENSIVLCRPGATDWFKWDTRRRTRHGYFHFDVATWPRGLPPSHNWPLVRLPGTDDIMPVLFRHILTWSGHGNALHRNIAITHLLTAFWSGETTTRDAVPDALPEAVQRATRFIAQHMQERPERPIPLPDIARAACVTPEHLCRVMKSATGHSPLETVRLARLDRAVTLLARSNYSVGEIATLCGFASAFHFSRRFKETYGQSPRDVRHAVRNGATPPLSALLQHVRL